jgi:MFS superfamily sulfate permease-like transporter
MSVTFLLAIFQVAMGVFHLGIVSTFMSMSFISGFMTGAGFHILTSQMPFLFGIKINRISGIFKLPRIYIELFQNITQTNIATLICSVICLAVLIFFKEFINERFKSKLKVSIPAELIVVVVGIIVSHFGRLHEQFNVQVLQSIPTGLPPPTA